MKFSLTWLKDHLETETSVADISAKLNAIGLEVEGIENPADKLAGFKVARVLTASPHPNADKLQVLSVDAGEAEPLQVVCGAPNARAGMIGVLGMAGAIVPGGGFELKKSAIRGVESNGMMCSVRELELGEEHDGIIELPADAPVGMAFADYHGSDPVFDVAITPNRPDCMGVYGIARDLAAAGLGMLKPIAAQAVRGSFPCPLPIRTDDPEGCPAFYGRVIKGVKNGASPQWLQDRLISAGQRPISALVDITNYVMLAYGRPAHAYDLARLRGAVFARHAHDGETCLALNGKLYTLTSDMTVIADDNGVHDIAGIMGGAHSGCSDTTTDVLLEVAYFDPERIGNTGRALNLTSDARQRFERGADPAFLDAGLAILTDLIIGICGGEPSEVVRAGTPPTAPKLVKYNPALAETLGGVAIPDAQQRATLSALGFASDAGWTVTVPSWRPDVDGAPDIVEEVVRIHGLDNVASVALPRAEGVARPTATPEQQQERKLRRAAAALGLNEAITWSFISETEAEAVGGGSWVLQNPISEDMKVMRPSLLPGLLAAVQRNLDRGASVVRLFEIGRRYLADGEHPTLVLVLAGDKAPRQWHSGKAQAFDAFDAKAMCLELLREAGAPVDNLMVMGDAGNVYHPGQSATLRLGPKTVLASFGMVHPATLKMFDIDGPVAVAGIHLDAIPVKKAADFARSAYAPPALQAVTRDFAFLVDKALPAGDLVRAVKGCDKVNVAAVRLFDRFEMPDGKLSLAIEVTLQPGEKSYDEAELKAIAERVTGAAAKLGAVLRG
ncbi:phenylalanine--tRNA ligase subunit beta [Novosphingobium sp.]|uniref:phenylalanine--tRNA ligase subunit beta n=1 Tax=Novosphingobium sp. TaxID=1874826 RepID=UPI00286D4240|nr:phenylalanine--tRNA ligase subunit beta [Novosphingobium sp.]